MNLTSKCQMQGRVTNKDPVSHASDSGTIPHPVKHFFTTQFINHETSYKLQEFKDQSKSQNKHRKNVIKNVMHCFILNAKEFPIR